MRVAVVGGTGQLRPGGREAARRRGHRGRDRLARRGARARGGRAARRRGRDERRRGPRRRSRPLRGQGGRGGRDRPASCASRSARRRSSRSAPSSPSARAASSRRPRPTSIAQRIQDELDAPVAAGLHSLAASNLAEAPPDEDALVCGDDAAAKELALELAAELVSGRAVDCGPLASARALEGMTAVIVNVNRRYKAHAGLRDHRPPVTGRLSGLPARGHPGDRGGRRSRRAARRRGRARRRARGRRRRRRRAEDRLEGGGARRAARRDRAVRAGARARRRRAIRATSRRSCARASASSAPRPPLVIAETRHGFVCASAGVDASNAKGEGTLVLLPARSGRLGGAASATACATRTGRDVAVIVSDSFGRPFRQGTTDVALGVAGHHAAARPARAPATGPATSSSATQIAVADELAGAAELVLGKAERRIRPRSCAASTCAARARAATC